MPEYTPTSDEVREDFAFPWEGFKQDREARFAAFDRWLADRDKEVAAHALEAFADTLGVDAGDEDSDELRGFRNGQRQALRKATERAASIRSGSEGGDT